MKEDRPTSFDIAYLAGVSQSTVSRALRNSPLVSKETRDKVQSIAKQLNYKVDINARNLRSKHSNTIALLFCEDPGSGDSLINPFFLSMLGSITRATANRGYDLLISFQQSSADWQADYEDSHRADGIIFLGYGDYVTYSQRIRKLEREGAHFITWGPVLAQQPGVFVGCDNHNGAYRLVKHLLALGRRRIAFIGGADEHCPEFRERYQGYQHALREAGLAVDPRLQADAETTEAAGYRAVRQLRGAGLAFDAVFGASDLIAIGAIKALQEAGISVPGDIAVVGFDDIPTASYTSPPLTTVQQDTKVAGELLVSNLLKLVNGEAVSSQLLPAALIVRGSCGQAAG